MSIVTPPVTITPTGAGSTVQIQQPQSAGQLSQLILDNLSTYLLAVQIGSSTKYQAPLVEAAYDLQNTNNQPVIVHAIQQPGDLTTSGQIAPTWNNAGEEIEGIWPIALSGPAEIAAATAAALLTTGIPNVLTEKIIAATQTLASGAQTPDYDVSGYASVVLEVTANPDTTARAFQVVFKDHQGNVAEIYVASAPADALSNTIDSVIVPVRGYPTMYVSWLNPAAIAPGTSPSFTLYGSNRTTAGMVSTQVHGAIDHLTTGNVAMALNNSYSLGYVGEGGLCQIEFSNTNAAVTGEIFATCTDAQGVSQSIRIADTSEMHAAGTAQRVYKQVILPQSTTTLGFICRAAGTTTVSANIVRTEYV